MLGDSNVTVATGNSRHYQPPRRKKRRHRRKSSNLLFSTFFFALLLLLHPPPYSSFLSLSHSLSSLVHPSPSPYAQRSQCVGPIQRLDENGPEPFSTPKRRTKGVAEDGRKHERKQMPRQPRLIYATPYPVLLFLLSPPASSHPLPSRHLPLPRPDISVPDRSGWDVCGLLLHCSQKSEEDPLN